MPQLLMFVSYRGLSPGSAQLDRDTTRLVQLESCVINSSKMVRFGSSHPHRDRTSGEPYISWSWMVHIRLLRLIIGNVHPEDYKSACSIEFHSWLLGFLCLVPIGCLGGAVEAVGAVGAVGPWGPWGLWGPISRRQLRDSILVSSLSISCYLCIETFGVRSAVMSCLLPS